MKTKPLSERHTPKAGAEITSIANKQFPDCEGLTVFWEHGHWWLKIYTDVQECLYDVVDANTDSGIDFELIEETEAY